MARAYLADALQLLLVGGLVVVGQGEREAAAARHAAAVARISHPQIRVTHQRHNLVKYHVLLPQK